MQAAQQRPARRTPQRSGDGRLVGEALAGNVDAFGELYGRHREYLCKVISSRTNDPEARADIEQETFTRAFAKLATLREPSAFRPWIAQIARRLTTDDHRRRTRVVATDFAAADQADEPVDPDWGPDEWAAMRLLGQRLGVGITCLNSRDATVLTMAANLGFGPSEIAGALSIDQGHARVVLHRARNRLAAQVLESLDPHAGERQEQLQ